MPHQLKSLSYQSRVWRADDSTVGRTDAEAKPYSCQNPRFRRLLKTTSVNETPHPIREEHVDLLWLDQCGYFAVSISRMRHRLTGAVRVRPVVRSAGMDRKPQYCARTAFKGAEGPAFRTAYARNLAAYGDGRHYMAAFLVAHRAQFIRPLAYCIYLLLH